MPETGMSDCQRLVGAINTIFEQWVDYGKESPHTKFKGDRARIGGERRGQCQGKTMKEMYDISVNLEAIGLEFYQQIVLNKLYRCVKF